MTAPNPANGAPYTWIILCDNNFNYLGSLPIGAPGGILAGSDGQTAANVPESQMGLFNGTTVDRWRSTAAGDSLTTGVGALGLYGFNGASQDRIKTTAAGDGQVNGILGAGMYVYNGTNMNRVSTANPVPVQDVGTGNVTIVQQSASISAGASGTCTLAAAVGKTTYIVGFTVSSAAAAAVVNGIVTVTGVTNTMSFTYDNLVTNQSYLSQYFGERGVPGNAVNTTVVVNFPAITGGAATSVVAWGYQL